MNNERYKEVKEEKRFVQISPETISLIADSVGIPSVPPSVSRGLAEDVSYRVREITHVCSQFLKHGKRRKLTTNDFTRALAWYDCDPIYGQNTRSQPNFVRVTEADVYVPDTEKLVNLYNYSLSNTSHTSTHDEVIKSSWLSLEGGDTKEHKVNEQAHQVSAHLIQYYTSVTRVLLGSSKEALNIVLEDIRTNPKIGTVLRYFVTFIRNILQKYCENKPLTTRILLFLQALFLNPYINMTPKPYLSHLVTGLFSIIIIESRGKEIQESVKFTTLKVDHVPLASSILSRVLKRWSTPVNMLKSHTLRPLREYLLEPSKVSYSSQYGALYALMSLGPDVVERCLIPQIDSYFKNIFYKYHGGSKHGVLHHQSERKIIARLIGLLLITSRMVLTERVKKFNFLNEDKSIKKEQPNVTLSSQYNDIYDLFGSQLSYCPLPPLIGPDLPPPSLLKIQFKIKRLDSSINRISEAPTSTNIFGTSNQNFEHLADMGVPSDIFDDDERFMDVQNGLNSENEVSQKVSEIFDIHSKNLLKFRRINIGVGNPLLVKKPVSVKEKHKSKGKARVLTGKRIGFPYSKRFKILRLYSGSLYSVL